MTNIQPAMPVLDLVTEAKIHQILVDPVDERFEASGVCIKDGFFYVIFDNAPQVARINLRLGKPRTDNRIFETGHRGSGYEDIAYDPHEDRFFVLIEALEITPGTFKAKIVELTGDLHYLSAAWADFPLARRNKGLEGLTCVYRGGKRYLLGLCEGNKCKGGALGREPGKGRIQIFEKDGQLWRHRGKIKLPKSLPFEDYASLDINDERIAVVSQASSLLWLGSFKPERWEFVDEGRIYQFPKNHKGNTVYCNIEGVAWLDPDRIVVVSDKTKRDEQDKRCRSKDQSIHIFRIPASPATKAHPSRCPDS